MLPPSIRKHVSIDDSEYNFPVTIRELAQADFLMINRSDAIFDSGFRFRLGDFKCILELEYLELWVKIN
jgi:hypothetical protein